MNKQAAGYDLLRSIQRYIDSNEMVNTEIGYEDSGNGLYLSSVLILLLNELNPDCIDKLWFENIVKKCYRTEYLHQDLKVVATYIDRGLLLKAPRGGFSKDQQTWDDLLGVAAACIVIGNREIPRDIWKYLNEHFGFYNTTDKFRWDSWLVRSIPMTLTIICAAYPFMKYPLFIPLYLASRFMNLNTADPSGMQLIWVYHAGCKGLGFHFKKYDEVTKLLPQNFREYYKSIGMPFKDAASALQ